MLNQKNQAVSTNRYNILQLLVTLHKLAIGMDDRGIYVESICMEERLSYNNYCGC